MLQSQNQLGQNLWGDNNQDRFGASVALANTDGTLAVGAYRSDVNGTESGLTRIFQFDGTSWNQSGNDINGDAAGDWLGYSVDLNDDGQILVVGATGNNNKGVLRVYQWQDPANDWLQIGQDIDGENIGDSFGFSCSINSVGDIVVGGAVFNDDSGNDSGSVRVFQYNGSSWDQLGQDIDGEYSEDKSGHSVSLSSDGYTLSVGAGHNSENGFEIGHVRIYTFDINTNTWIQKGSDIDGEGPDPDHFGYSNSISSDGYTVAVGAPANNQQSTTPPQGHVRAYKFDGVNWLQVGQDIDGIGIGNAGWDVSLSGDGSVLILGSPQNNTNGSYSGEARIYQLAANNWNQIGITINGQGVDYSLGADTDINRAGTKIAISATLANGGPTGQYTGMVQVYDIGTLLNTNENDQNLIVSISPNPSNSIVTINSIKDYKIELFDMNGRLLIEDVGNSLDISKLSNAVYIIKLTDLESNQSLDFKIIKN